MQTTLFKKIAAIFLLALTVNFAKAQCTASYSYTLGANGTVNFLSTSTGTTSTTNFMWSFGDNTSASFMNNPAASHTYSNSGWYVVTLWATDSVNNCSASTSQTINVNNALCLGNAAFSSTQLMNGNVSFQNNSNAGGGATYAWAFGDGSTSTQNFPSHTYTANGVYTVTLVATSASATCTYTAAQTISVTILTCSLNASFNYTNGTNGVVNFASTSTGTTSNSFHYWTFGDGGTAIGPVVSHTYSSNSVWNVILTINDSIPPTWSCSDQANAAVTVTNSICNSNASFSLYKDSTALPAIVWNGTPNLPPTTTAVFWNWGDGTVSGGFTPSHTYTAAGVYTICMTVTVSCGSVSTFCSSNNIYKTISGAQTNGIEMSAGATVNILAVGPTGIVNTNNNEVAVNLYPNPTSGEFEIKINGNSDKNAQVKIYNVLGQEVYSSIENGNTVKKIDLSNLSNGSYFVKVISGNGSKNSKLVISK